MKRKTAAWLLLVCLLCLLSACGKAEPAETAWSEAQMARAVWDSQGGAEEAGTLLFDSGDFTSYISEYYRIAPDSVQGGAILYAGGVSAQEVAVLRLTDAEAADGAEKALQSYINDRAGAFAGYAPEQYAIVENSGTVSRGQYAVLLICPDRQAALDAFAACFTVGPPVGEPVFASAGQPDSPAKPAAETPSPPPEEPEPAEGPAVLEEPSVQPPDGSPELPQDEPGPETVPEPEAEPEAEPEPEPRPEPAPEPQDPWSYDRERIVNAWNDGNRDGLWEQDLAILEVLDGISALTDGTLSDYDRELALHDWMIDWAEYDPGALSNNPRGEPMPDNDNPYGFLTGKKGICRGYASTFHLLMELSGITCVTVDGASHAGTAEHAWNLVMLDGDWYAVDATWDDPVTSAPVLPFVAHMYFNVTSEFLRRTDHQWDESVVPEAEGTALVWVS